MADRSPSVFKVVQSYGGLKEAYLEVATMDTDDVLKFASADNVKQVKFIQLCKEDDTAGRLDLSFARGGADNNELTLKTAAMSGIKVSGVVKYREY